MTAKLIVGFRTRPIEEDRLKAIMPEIQANKGYTDKDKIKKDIDDRTAAFLASCKDWAYTGTFDSVVIADPKHERVNQWNYAGREPGGKKPPICLSVASWILKEYPTAWTPGTKADEWPEFLGFDMRQFLKMLGAECSLPEHARPLPHRMWIANSDHRDIGELILPKDFEKVTLLSALKRRRPQEAEAAKKWDEKLSGWTEPHQDPVTDVWLTTELANQLGYLAD